MIYEPTVWRPFFTPGRQVCVASDQCVPHFFGVFWTQSRTVLDLQACWTWTQSRTVLDLQACWTCKLHRVAAPN